MSNPKVSIAMSVYNGDAYLRESLDSLQSQTLNDWELVVIDDGSTDSSGRILDEYAVRDPRFRVVHQENKGLTRSLNESISLAKGEFIARMDADDACHPERLAKQVQFLQEKSDYVAVGCRTTLVDQQGQELRRTSQPLDHPSIDTMLIRGVTAIAHPSLMIRRCALDVVGGYCELYRTAQDLDLLLKLTEQGRVANLEEPLLRYRWHAENVSVRKADQQDRDVTAILQAALKRRGLPPLRGVPPIRLQIRRNLARQYAMAGNRAVALQMAWGACRLRPSSVGNWGTLLGVLTSPRLLDRLTRFRRRLARSGATTP
jgi:glycosyltransferase involved in cell wall biosynthesis